MMLEVSTLGMLHLQKATQHPIVLNTVIGSTLAFNFVRICFLLTHPDVAFPSIGSLLLPCLWHPILLLFDFCISSSIPLLSSLLVVFPPFSLCFFLTHTSSFSSKKLSPLFSSYAFNLYCVIFLSSLQEPHECPSTSTAQFSVKKQFNWQELREQISITFIKNCTMKLREDPN